MRTLGPFVNDILDAAQTDKYRKQLTQLLVDTMARDPDTAVKALRVAGDYAHSDNRSEAAFGLMVLDSICRNNSTLRKLAQATITNASTRPPKTPPITRRILGLPKKIWAWCKL